MVQVTDYCGLVSGEEVDKATLFRNFYGRLRTAPMIEECPANMECQVIQTLDLGTHEIFIGEIAATYCNEDCLTQGKGEDLLKVNPILFSMSGGRYFSVGQEIGRAWDIGKSLKSEGAAFRLPSRRSRRIRDEAEDFHPLSAIGWPFCRWDLLAIS